MAKKWRNLMLSTEAEILEETLFDEDKKADAKKDHAEKKVKLKKDETASSHLCPHAVAGDLSEEWYDCRVDPRAEYEEFTKKDDFRLTDILVPMPGPEGV